MINANKEKFVGGFKSNMRFAAKHGPEFKPGAFNENNPPPSVIKSPYYWWFMFLRLNKEYAKAIKKGGTGKYAEICSDFGDVSKINFKEWWENNQHLFAEPRIGYQMRVAESISEIAPFDSNEAINLVIPLTLSRRELANAFKIKVLDQFEKGMPLDRLRQTKAKYKLASKWNAEALRCAYRVYDEREKAKNLGVKIAWADIAVLAKLKCAHGIKNSRGDLDMGYKRRNATIQAIRHYNKALKHINAAATKTFPNLG